MVELLAAAEKEAQPVDVELAHREIRVVFAARHRVRRRIGARPAPGLDLRSAMRALVEDAPAWVQNVAQLLSLLWCMWFHFARGALGALAASGSVDAGLGLRLLGEGGEGGELRAAALPLLRAERMAAELLVRHVLPSRDAAWRRLVDESCAVELAAR